MSEQAPAPQHPDIDVDMAFDYEKRQAQPEWETYLENRPYTDENGVAHDPATGQFINPDKYFDRQREISKEAEQTPYEEMSMHSLAYKLGEAEFHGDKTTESNVHSVLMDKMKAEDERLAKQGDSEIIEERRQNVVDSAMAAKDLKIRQLEKQHPRQPEEDESSEEEGALSFKDTILGNQDDFSMEEYVNAHKEEIIKAQKERKKPNLPEESRGVIGMYSPDEKGLRQKAIAFAKKNEVINWDNPAISHLNGNNRQIIIRGAHRNGTEGYGSYLAYIDGDKMYEIVQGSDNYNPGVRVVELTPEDRLPVLRIGQDIGGFELSQVEIGSGEFSFSYDWSRFNHDLRQFSSELAQGSPVEVWSLLDSLKDQGHLSEYQYNKMTKRVKDISEQAWDGAVKIYSPRGDNPFAEMEELVARLEGRPEEEPSMEPDDQVDRPTIVMEENAAPAEGELEHDSRFDEQTVEALKGKATLLTPEGEAKVRITGDGYFGTVKDAHYMFVGGEEDEEPATLATLDRLRFSEERREQMREAGINEEIESLIQSLSEQGEPEPAARELLFDEVALGGMLRNLGRRAKARLSSRRRRKQES
jgi:hypothetical protein